MSRFSWSTVAVIVAFLVAGVACAFAGQRDAMFGCIAAAAALAVPQQFPPSGASPALASVLQRALPAGAFIAASAAALFLSSPSHVGV